MPSQENIFDAHLRTTTRYIEPQDFDHPELPLIDRDDGKNVICVGCGCAVTLRDFEQHNVVPVNDAPQFAHYGCVLSGIWVNEETANSDYRYLLMKATAEIEYLYLPNAIVQYQDGAAIVRCAPHLVRDQLGRLFSGFASLSGEIYESRGAALAQARRLAGIERYYSG